jgi:hypothetical protein
LFDKLYVSNKTTYNALKGLSVKGGLGLTTADIQNINNFEGTSAEKIKAMLSESGIDDI